MSWGGGLRCAAGRFRAICRPPTPGRNTRMNRRRLIASGAAGAAGAATLVTPNLASAQPRIRWRCPGSFPKSLDTLFGTQEYIAKRVSELTDGAFQIQVFGPGEVVPALQVLD